MWRWAISSSRGPVVPGACPGRSWSLRRLGLCLGGALLALVGPTSVAATVFLTVGEALELAFPGCRVERRTLFLTEDEMARARGLAGAEVENPIVHPYVARCAGALGGIAYFDAHRVRTLPETLMVVVGPAGEVRRVEVLSFSEPPDYLPGDGWYGQFEGRELDDELRLRRGIRGVTGATLTARATAEAVRRTLALDRIVRERGVGDLPGAARTGGAAGERVESGGPQPPEGR